MRSFTGIDIYSIGYAFSVISMSRVVACNVIRTKIAFRGDGFDLSPQLEFWLDYKIGSAPTDGRVIRLRRKAGALKETDD
jgi:hypothetical protein